MSSRFHQKYHRYNHHSVTPGSGNVSFPDEGFDPIASFDSPFRGEFFSNDPIITTNNLSASQNVLAGLDVQATRNVLVGNDLTINYDLSVGRNVMITGDLTVEGTYTVLNTVTYTTSAVEILNNGTGPGLKVSQGGIEPIAIFIDSSGPANNLVAISNNSKLGIGTTLPEADLHIKREYLQEAQARIQGTNPTLSLKTDTAQFELTQTNNGAVVAKTNSSGSPVAELYKIKLADNSDAVTILSSGNVGIGTLSPNQRLTVSGNVSCKDLFIPNRSAIIPSHQTLLPSTNDVIFDNHTDVITITAFSNGMPNTLYTLTNKSSYSVILASSNRLFVRGTDLYTKSWSLFRCNGGNSSNYKTWTNFKCASGQETNWAVELLANHSCFLRMDSATVGSIW